MSDWLNEQLGQSFGWLNHIWLRNKAHFHLNGAVNSNSHVFLGKEKSEETSQNRLECPKVIALVAFNAKPGLLRPYWLEEMCAPLPPTPSVIR